MSELYSILVTSAGKFYVIPTPYGNFYKQVDESDEE